MVACALCGTSPGGMSPGGTSSGGTSSGSEPGGDADTAAPPLTWSSAVERGRLQHYCEQCTRENVRAMEGKLDSEYW